MNNPGDKAEVKGRMIRGIKWTALQSVVVAAGNFATAVLAARLLGVDDFGAFSIIRITGFMMATMAGAGLGVTATKYIAEMREIDKPRLSRILGLCSMVAGCTSLVFSSVILFFASQVATVYLKAPHIVEQLRIAALYIFFVTLNGYQIGALAGFEAFSVQAKINLVQAVVSLMLTFVLTWFWGLSGASAALGLAALFNWGLHQQAIQKEVRRNGIRTSYSGLWQEKNILLNFTFPAALSSIIGATTVWCCNAFLTRQPDGLSQMAIFSAANNFRSFILFVPGLVSHVASPILCNLKGEKKQSSYSRLFWINILISAAASIAVAGILVMVAPYVLRLFGRGFVGGGAVAMAIVVMTVIEVMANAFYRSLFAHGKLWWQVRIMVGWSLVLGIVSFTTIGSYGAIGLAYAYLAAHSVSLTLYAFATYKIQKEVSKTVGKGEGLCVYR